MKQNIQQENNETHLEGNKRIINLVKQESELQKYKFFMNLRASLNRRTRKQTKSVQSELRFDRLLATDS